MKKSMSVCSILSFVILTSCGGSFDPVKTFNRLLDEYDTVITHIHRNDETYQYYSVQDFNLKIKAKDNNDKKGKYFVKLSIYDGSFEDPFAPLVAKKCYTVDKDSSINDTISNIYLTGNYSFPYKLETTETLEEDYIKDFMLENN